MHFFNSAREHWKLFILGIECKGCMMMMNGRELSIISISIFGGAFITADNLAEYTNMILVYSVYNIYIEVDEFKELSQDSFMSIFI